MFQQVWVTSNAEVLSTGFPSILENHVPRSSEPYYFDSLDPSIRPDAVGRGGNMGSEGDMARLIRNAANGKQMLDHPSIHSMRSCRCREALLVDDIIGTGKRAREFTDAFVNHWSIRSARSRHKLRVSIVVYAATGGEIRHVEAHPGVSRVICVRRLGKGSRLWNREERAAILSLCERYAERTSRPRIPFGYGNALTLTVFEDHCPNTSPPILWSSGKQWCPLFAKPANRGFEIWPEAEDEEKREQRFLNAVGQPKLARHPHWGKHLSQKGKCQIQILACISRGFRKPEIISEILSLSEEQTAGYLRDCRRYNWITWDNFLTVQGRDELQFLKRADLLEQKKEVALDESFYYPKVLRKTSGFN